MCQYNDIKYCQILSLLFIEDKMFRTNHNIQFVLEVLFVFVVKIN